MYNPKNRQRPSKKRNIIRVWCLSLTYRMESNGNYTLIGTLVRIWSNHYSDIILPTLWWTNMAALKSPILNSSITHQVHFLLLFVSLQTRLRIFKNQQHQPSNGRGGSTSMPGTYGICIPSSTNSKSTWVALGLVQMSFPPLLLVQNCTVSFWEELRFEPWN